MGNSCGIFPVEYSNRKTGRENTSTDFAPVPAGFPGVFPGFPVFLTKQFMDGLDGMRCRSGRDFLVPFSSLWTRAWKSLL
jgi:hypothetical protein